MMNSSSVYKINWLDLSHVGYPQSVSIGSLIGCKHRFVERSMKNDLNILKSNNIRHIFMLCEPMELQRFGVSLSSFNEFELYHYPVEYGLFPIIEILMEIISKICCLIQAEEKCIIVSRDGVGRSSLIGAILILHTNETLNFSDVYAMMKISVDRRAIQTIKQYNFLVDFRKVRDEYLEDANKNFSRGHTRHLSR